MKPGEGWWVGVVRLSGVGRSWVGGYLHKRARRGGIGKVTSLNWDFRGDAVS